MLKPALWYAKRGWYIFPLCGKEPLTKHGVKEATVDIDRITNWFVHKKNIGIACGERSNLLVIDIDGKEGIETMQSLSKTYGRDWFKTPMVKTSKGYHIYFNHCDGFRNSVKALKGIDIRTDGGYVVAPPSIHPSGVKYTWKQDPNEYECLDIPDFFNSLQRDRDALRSNNWIGFSRIEEGSRNDSITKIIGLLLGKGIDSTLAYSLITSYNKTNVKPPLPVEELDRTFDSVYALEERKRNGR